jgi:hypothetical protein
MTESRRVEVGKREYWMSEVVGVSPPLTRWSGPVTRGFTGVAAPRYRQVRSKTGSRG